MPKTRNPPPPTKPEKNTSHLDSLRRIGLAGVVLADQNREGMKPDRTLRYGGRDYGSRNSTKTPPHSHLHARTRSPAARRRRKRSLGTPPRTYAFASRQNGTLPGSTPPTPSDTLSTQRRPPGRHSENRGCHRNPAMRHCRPTHPPHTTGNSASRTNSRYKPQRKTTTVHR